MWWLLVCPLLCGINLIVLLALGLKGNPIHLGGSSTYKLCQVMDFQFLYETYNIIWVEISVSINKSLTFSLFLWRSVWILLLAFVLWTCTSEDLYWALSFLTGLSTRLISLSPILGDYTLMASVVCF